MLELAPLAETAQLTQDVPLEGASTLRTLADGLITAGAVAGAYRVGRRGVMGYYTKGADVDVAAARMDRDPKAVVVMVAAYAAFTALTTAAVYLTATLALALAWGGVCAFVAAVVALQAAKNATPVDDVRLLAAAGDRDAD